MALKPTDFVAEPVSQKLTGGPPIPFSAQTVTAFVGRTERGPVDRAISVRNYNHFRQVFGGHATFSFISYAVQHFFLHGGKSAVIVRVVNRANRALIRVPAGGDFLELEARRPGSREFIRVSIDYDGVDDQPALFNLIVQRLSRPGSQLVEDQEIFSRASMNPVDECCIANLLAHSRLIALRGVLPSTRPEATGPKHPGNPIPYLDAAVRGSDGVELSDYDIIGSNEDVTGMFSLDAVDRIDLLCLPPPPGRDLGITTFLAAERYCERRRALLIWDPPRAWQSAETALIGARSSPAQGRNAVTYFPRIRSRLERVGLPTALPACGAVAGILSNKASYAEWTESSDTDPLLKISLAPTVALEEGEAATLNRAGVNVLRATRYGGAAFDGNVTLAPADGTYQLWRRLDRRRLLWFILDSLENTGKELTEDTTDAVAGLEHRVQIFLEGLHARGALAGRVADEAFVVRRVLSVAEDAAEFACLRIGIALDIPGEFLLYDLHVARGVCRTSPVPAFEAQQLAG